MLKTAKVGDVTSTSCASILFHVKHFPSTLPSDATTDDFIAKFNMYQVEDLPPSATQATRADEHWKNISQLQY